MPRDLRDVIEAIVAGVVVLDTEGRVEEMNSAACRFVEASRRAKEGAPVEELITPRHAVARLARTALASGTSLTEADQPIERRSRDDALVDVTASPLFDAAGRVDGAVVVMRDRTMPARLEQLEAEQHRYEAFGRIAAGLAHEIKNPLGGIRGAGELLGRRAEDDKTREIADMVVREATRIASLVDDLMVFSRGDALRPAPLNVHRVLDDVLQLLSLDPLAQGIDVVRTFDPSLPELSGDADRLTQVFLNLARNALQAMAPGPGTLTIETRMELDHRIVLQDGKSVPTLSIAVCDTGDGMTAEQLRQATTPFFTTRSGGTGLGLAVADYWVSQHRGALDIESAPDEGTRVRVSLPLRRS
ncbi:MAG: ATP-binding protein [Myxococcota bacterium]|nr:ATP-binding protein [Myxococcota bacterium]